MENYYYDGYRNTLFLKSRICHLSILTNSYFMPQNLLQVILANVKSSSLTQVLMQQKRKKTKC